MSGLLPALKGELSGKYRRFAVLTYRWRGGFGMTMALSKN